MFSRYCGHGGYDIVGVETSWANDAENPSARRSTTALIDSRVLSGCRGNDIGIDPQAADPTLEDPAGRIVAGPKVGIVGMLQYDA